MRVVKAHRFILNYGIADSLWSVSRIVHRRRRLHRSLSSSFHIIYGYCFTSQTNNTWRIEHAFRCCTKIFYYEGKGWMVGECRPWLSDGTIQLIVSSLCEACRLTDRPAGYTYDRKSLWFHLGRAAKRICTL